MNRREFVLALAALTAAANTPAMAASLPRVVYDITGTHRFDANGKLVSVGPPVRDPRTTLTVRLHADLSDVRPIFDEIALLRRKAGNIPQRILDLLVKGVNAMGEELTFGPLMPAGRTGECLVKLGLNPSGNFARALAALRALKIGDGNRHGLLSVKNGVGGTNHSSGERGRVIVMG